MTEKSVIKRRARQLPPEYQQKVLDYIDSLLLDIQKENIVKPNSAGLAVFLMFRMMFFFFRKKPFFGVTLMKYLIDANKPDALINRVRVSNERIRFIKLHPEFD
jgi:hypothetical protein